MKPKYNIGEYLYYFCSGRVGYAKIHKINQNGTDYPNILIEHLRGAIHYVFELPLENTLISVHEARVYKDKKDLIAAIDKIY